MPSPQGVLLGVHGGTAEPCRLPGHDLAPAEDQVRSCVQVQAAGLMQCACSCSAGNVAHLPRKAHALAWLGIACQALISIV